MRGMSDRAQRGSSPQLKTSKIITRLAFFDDALSPTWKVDREKGTAAAASSLLEQSRVRMFFKADLQSATVLSMICIFCSINLSSAKHERLHIFYFQQVFSFSSNVRVFHSNVNISPCRPKFVCNALVFRRWISPFHNGQRVNMKFHWIISSSNFSRCSWAVQLAQP